MRRQLLRDESDLLVITRGFERCLAIYPMQRWKFMEKSLNQLNPFMPNARRFIRSFVWDSDELMIDGQGRITLPKRLMDFAGITDKATIVGTLDHIEVWSSEALDDYSANDSEEVYAELAEELMADLYKEEEDV
jgi:MraZ protein